MDIFRETLAKSAALNRRQQQENLALVDQLKDEKNERAEETRIKERIQQKLDLCLKASTSNWLGKDSANPRQAKVRLSHHDIPLSNPVLHPYMQPP